MVTKKIPKLIDVLNSIPSERNELLNLEKRLKPSQDHYGSIEGFMGKNENLKSILIEDYNTLKKIGRTYSEIADRIEELMFDKQFGKIGNYKFCGEFTCGEQECPWKDGSTCNQYVMWLIPSNDNNPLLPGEIYKNKNVIEISGLLPHLIKEHYFFEGKKSRYRVNPEKISKIIFQEVLPLKKREFLEKT